MAILSIAIIAASLFVSEVAYCNETAKPNIVLVFADDGGREKLATNNSVELYNLKEDIGERVDLSRANIAKRDELLDELLAWQESINAPIPTQPNPAYAPGTFTRGKGKKSKTRNSKESNL